MADEHDGAELCDWCGTVITDGSELYSFARDSSVIHSRNPRFDGHRFLTACGHEHMQQLIEQYHQRLFVEAELWAGKIERAIKQHPGQRIDDATLVELTGLTVDQIHQGIDYQNKQVREFWRGRRRGR
ncbi:hypothetical protein [Saccharopolyspora griseoalba]|uniref:Uncharacterized protein n=1 Tax=Saccharopolyspora griseoalba TaxID=1431848 RepID=A0ABW2LRN7_9PSEU